MTELSNLGALAGGDGVLAARLLDRLAAAGAHGLTATELARAVAGEVPAEEVPGLLARLGREGEVVQREHRWYALLSTDWIVGTLERLEGGDALLRSGAGREAGYFVPRRHLRGAGDSDLVVARRLQPPRRKGGPRGRQEGVDRRRLPEAAVLEVLDRGPETLVGTLEIDADRRWLVPFDPRGPELEVVGGESLLEDQYVVVAVERGRGGVARGRVVEVLGSVAQPGVDVAVVIHHHGIDEAFPARVLNAAASLPEDPTPTDWRGREDLRALPAVTIDGETARDFDDAISVEELPAGALRLGIHIADVAHYVAEGGALDLEAYRRGTSVYYPERAVPMLPERLSNGLCSLRPEVPRLTLSAFLDLDAHGRVAGRRFAESVIQSARRLTYGEVRRVLEEPRAADAADYGAVLPLLQRAARAMTLLNRARTARGSLDFDLPEGDVILDTDGYTVGIRPQQRNLAHRVVEEFMIAANEAVAEELVTHECAALFRVHAEPTRERLEELRQLLRPLGLALRGDLGNLHPSALRDVLAKIAGRPEEAFVSAVVLRTMQRALYDPECRGHYALASRYYTHFTSPIRRYPDLVVHRRLRALLRGRAPEEAERTWLAERLPVVAEHASTTERRAEQSERDLLQWKKVRFLEPQVGRRFHGRITGVQPFGLFVQLEELLVDGLVPIRTLADDYYLYEADGHRLVGEHHGRVFQLGDPVEVLLAGVDHRHRGLDLEIVGMPEPRAPAPPRRERAAKRAGDRGVPPAPRGRRRG